VAVTVEDLKRKIEELGGTMSLRRRYWGKKLEQEFILGENESREKAGSGKS